MHLRRGRKEEFYLHQHYIHTELSNENIGIVETLDYYDKVGKNHRLVALNATFNDRTVFLIVLGACLMLIIHFKIQ